MAEPTFSPDGKWMWNGDEWIPAPPDHEPTVKESENLNKGDDGFKNELLRLQYERHIETLTERNKGLVNAVLFFGFCTIASIMIPAEVYDEMGLGFPSGTVNILLFIGSIGMTAMGWVGMGKTSSEIKETKRKLRKLRVNMLDD